MRPTIETTVTCEEAPWPLPPLRVVTTTIIPDLAGLHSMTSASAARMEARNEYCRQVMRAEKYTGTAVLRIVLVNDGE